MPGKRRFVQKNDLLVMCSFLKLFRGVRLVLLQSTTKKVSFRAYSGTQGCWYLDFENLPILVKSDDFFTISTPGSFCTALDRSPRLKTLSRARLWCFRASVVPTTPSGGRDRARIPSDPSIWGGRPYKDLHRILELRATKKRCRIPRDPECFEKIRYTTF